MVWHWFCLQRRNVKKHVKKQRVDICKRANKEQPAFVTSNLATFTRAQKTPPHPNTSLFSSGWAWSTSIDDLINITWSFYQKNWIILSTSFDHLIIWLAPVDQDQPHFRSPQFISSDRSSLSCCYRTFAFSLSILTHTGYTTLAYHAAPVNVSTSPDVLV